MGTKFTKGPWIIQLDKVSKDVEMPDLIIGPSIGLQICHVYCDNGQDKANAALIAAAPELYEVGESISISGPDADGFFWLKIQGSKSAGINLGQIKGDLAYLAIAEWMDKRNSSLKKARGES